VRAVGTKRFGMLLWLRSRHIVCLFVSSSVNEFLINDLTFVRTLTLQRKTHILKFYYMQPEWIGGDRENFIQNSLLNQRNIVLNQGSLHTVSRAKVSVVCLSVTLSKILLALFSDHQISNCLKLNLMTLEITVRIIIWLQFSTLDSNHIFVFYGNCFKTYIYVIWKSHGDEVTSFLSTMESTDSSNNIIVSSCLSRV
jgi:hypothetical protein